MKKIVNSYQFHQWPFSVRKNFSAYYNSCNIQFLSKTMQKEMIKISPKLDRDNLVQI